MLRPSKRLTPKKRYTVGLRASERGNGAKIPDIDKINPTLNILDPMILPMTISLLCFTEATTDAASSGSDVPMPIANSAIIPSGMSHNWANVMVDDIIKFPPIGSIIHPNITINIGYAKRDVLDSDRGVSYEVRSNETHKNRIKIPNKPNPFQSVNENTGGIHNSSTTHVPIIRVWYPHSKFNFVDSTIGYIMPEIPKIRSELAMLLPIILPNTISGLLPNAANTLMINSGAEVPNETMVSPIINGDNLNR